MDLTYRQQAYLDLEKVLNRHQKNCSNLAIVSFPGFGASFLLKAYAAKNPKTSYIVNPNSRLTSFNLLDFDFFGNPNAPAWTDNYFKIASPAQKFAVVIQPPHLIEAEAIKSSYFWKHIYETYRLKTHSKSDIKLLFDRLKIKLSKKDFDSVHTRSQGIPQIAKFLAINHNGCDQSELQRILSPIQKTVSQCPDQLLLQFGITRAGFFDLPKSVDYQYQIIINFDLSFSEKDQPSPYRLTKEEKQILSFMLQNNGEINREKVADLKWGEGKYDSFSDQAIGQAMRRLNNKLQIYQITAIPKVGYKLSQK